MLIFLSRILPLFFLVAIKGHSEGLLFLDFTQPSSYSRVRDIALIDQFPEKEQNSAGIENQLNFEMNFPQEEIAGNTAGGYSSKVQSKNAENRARKNGIKSFDSIYLEAKAAFFYPTDSVFRKIYGDGSGIYGVEATFRFYRNIAVWGSMDLSYQTGYSIGSRDPTNITLIPLGLGLKYFFPVSYVDLYVAGGILGNYLHINDQSLYVVQHLSNWGVGGMAKVGAIFNFSNSVFLDLFTSYSYIKIDFHETQNRNLKLYKADVSNCSFGVGIGYRFGL